MKQTHLKLAALLITLMVSKAAFSQFIVSGEFRPRAELRNGYKTLNTGADVPLFFTSQRTRLNMSFKNNRYKTYLSLQDIRTWGSQPQLVNNEANAVSVHEAWVETFIAKQNKLSMKFGRQEIILDDHRIFGNVGWAQQARSHDALLFKYNTLKSTNVQLGLAYNQNNVGLKGTTYTVPSSYKTLQYLWLNTQPNKNLKMSFLFLNKGDEVRVDANNDGKITKGEFWNTYTQTIGTHTKFNKKKFSTTFNGYYQMGNTNSFLTRDVSAYLLGLDLNYQMAKKLAATLGMEMQSGNNQNMAASETNKAFNPYFGTNHKFNGLMDYFYVGNHINNVGLQDIYLKLKYKNTKYFIGADVHAFMSGADVFDNNNVLMDANLGTEVDITTGFNITKGVKFAAGYSMLFGTETLEALKGGDSKGTNNWAFAQIIIKPTFFNSSQYKIIKK